MGERVEKNITYNFRNFIREIIVASGISTLQNEFGNSFRFYLLFAYSHSADLISFFISFNDKNDNKVNNNNAFTKIEHKSRYLCHLSLVHQ